MSFNLSRTGSPITLKMLDSIEYIKEIFSRLHMLYKHNNHKFLHMAFINKQIDDQTIYLKF